MPHLPVPAEYFRSIDVLEWNDSKLHEQSIGVYVGQIFGRGLYIHQIIVLPFLWSRSRLVIVIGQVSLGCCNTLLT